METKSLFKSLRLSERIDYYLSRDVKNPIIDHTQHTKRNRIWEKILANPPFSQEQYLESFLIDTELTETELANLAGSVADILTNDILNLKGWWANSVHQLYADFEEDGNYFSDLFIETTPLSIFFDCFEPLIREARANLKLDFQDKDLPVAFEALENHLIFNIGHQLFEMLDRVMVLEMNVSRINQELTGSSPQERFNSFRNLLRSKTKQFALMEEYPVLFRQVYECLNTWREVSQRFILHLTTDWATIQTTFHVAEMLPIRKIHINAGDRHNGGQTVTILTFGSGEKVVYKPRNLSVDIHFQELLMWLNESLTTKHKILKICNKESHGWMEFVHHLPCQNNEEVQHFYERIGSMLCLLYAINAVDFHHENIIAQGEYPVLIDLESLFHPEAFLEDANDINFQIQKKMKKSVMSINMLPFKMYLDNGVVDISGVANTEGKEVPNPSLVWTAEGTDEMRLVTQKVKMGAMQNVPKLIDGTTIQILDYAALIEQSFRDSYQILYNFKQNLLAENSVVRMFAHDEIRLLFRATASYTQLLRAGFHPDYLRNQMDRDMLFNKLWVAIDLHKDYEKLIATEFNSLSNRDVPMFYGSPSSLDLWSEGKMIAPNFFEQSAMDLVLEKIRNLSEADCASQCWFIKASLASSSETDSHKGDKPITYITHASENEILPENLLDAAKSIGERILRMAITNKTDAHWLGLIMVDGIHYDVQPLALDFYSGMPGVALFMGAMYKATADERYNEILEKTLLRIYSESKRYFDTKFFKHIGAFSGWAGLMYVKYNLGKMLGREDLSNQAFDLAEMITEHLDIVHEHDIIAGVAGIIICLKRVYAERPSNKILKAIEVLSDKLMENAIKMPEGMGWKAHGSKPLAGFAHGGSGIALALFEAFELIPNPDYRHTAIEALRYERSVFIEDEGNWADLRDLIIPETSTMQGNMVAWCNGAVGVGLSRLALAKFYDDDLFQQEINIAIQTTLSKSFGDNHSLCHGDFGSLEFLLEAGKNNKEALKIAHQIAETLIPNIIQNGCICGVPLAVENPGFMTGISGIGYQMLRLLMPQLFPSVLLLQ